MYCHDLNWISTDVSEVRTASIINAMSERSVKNSVYSPLLTTLHELKTRTREACTNTDQEILHNVWQELNVGLMLLEPLVALKLNFVHDKLLFIKVKNQNLKNHLQTLC
jgi:hypothetical protein